MVKFYDKNMNEVYLPKDTDLHYGSYPLELNISSIEHEKQGQKRVPIGRQASLSAFIIASRETDMKLKIKRVYEFFRTLEEFYVADSDTPFELLKVSVDQSYDIGFGNGTLIEYEIPLTVHKPYFKQSLHTTADIDSEGVRWNDKWGYGMGLSSDSSEWKYRFKPTMTAKELGKSLFENGSIFLSNGQNADSNTQLGRLKNLYSVNKGQKYRLDLNETGGTINYIRIFHYDSNGNHISNEGTAKVNGNGNTSYEFTAQGNSIRLLLYANGDAQVNVGGIGTSTRIYLYGYYEHSHQFSFLNAGTEEIKLIQQKESTIRLKVKSMPGSGSVGATQLPFEPGGWLSSSGEKVTGSNPTQARTITPHNVSSGMILKTISNSLYEFNVLLFKNGESFGWVRTDTNRFNFGDSYTFDDSYEVRISAQRKDGEPISSTDISNINAAFSISSNTTVGSPLEIYDGKHTFRLSGVSSGDVLELKGHQVKLNSKNILQDTNKTFLTIKQGWNNWEIRGINDFEIEIDFRFLYD